MNNIKQNQYMSLIDQLLDIVYEAGDIIMGYYESDIHVEIKEDKSPVTEADIAANDFIVKELMKVSPEIPIIAEEGKNRDIGDSSSFWLVDPLDGTKGFIKRSGEFTVNIGLVDNSVPVLGVVYAPVAGDMYFTGDDGNAYKIDSNKTKQKISARFPGDEGLVVVASRSHLTDETKEFVDKLEVKEYISTSSSVKLCLIAEGKADIYPRFGPTMEWDIAAAQAVLLAAGGSVRKTDDTPLDYGKEDFLNPYFVAYGKEN